jgi:hypothetical protein
VDAKDQAKDRIRAMLHELRDLLHDSPRTQLTESDTKANVIDLLIAALGFSAIHDIKGVFRPKPEGFRRLHGQCR